MEEKKRGGGHVLVISHLLGEGEIQAEEEEKEEEEKNCCLDL